MRNELLGYLVGALESDEHARVESQLRADHQLARDVETLRRGLVPLEADVRLMEPPSGLAKRTSEFVLARVGLDAQSPASEAAVTRPHPVWSESPSANKRWRLTDLSVAAGILVAGFSVVVPAILQSRANAQRISCENRMQQTYAAIAGFAEHHNGKLPGPEPRPGFEGKAGIVGPLITQANFLKDHRALVCPGSDMASEDFAIPTLAHLKAANGPELERLTRVMGGTYAYAVGHWDDKGNYHPLVRKNGDNYPIMADLAGKNGKPIGHHGGCGRNVLFSNGVIKYLTTCRVAGSNNEMYLNDDGEQDAGTHEKDVVLLPGEIGIRLIKGR